LQHLRQTTLSNTQEDEEDLNWLVGDRKPFDSIDPDTLEIVPYSPVQDKTFYARSNHIEKRFGNPHPPKWEKIRMEQDEVSPITSQHSNTIQLTEGNANEQDDDGILSEFRPKSSSVRLTRRFQSSHEKSDNPLETYAPDQVKPTTLEELYDKTLPQVRNQLKQQGLKQVGSIKTSSSAVFDRYKYSSTKPLSKTSAPIPHDPFKPAGILRDPSLSAFTPKQWTGDRPTDAQDDMITAAIQGLITEFHVEPHPIAYLGDILSYQLLVNIQTSGITQAIMLMVSITVTHPATSRTLLYTERTMIVQGDKPVHLMRGELGLNTVALSLGSYMIYAQVFLISGREKVLLASHSPIEIFIMTKP
jgi:hypothetical protein